MLNLVLFVCSARNDGFDSSHFGILPLPELKDKLDEANNFSVIKFGKRMMEADMLCKVCMASTYNIDSF